MSRIDAAIATQVADTSRPRQVVLDSSLQNREAQVRDLDADDSALSTADPTPAEVRNAAARLKKVIESASGQQLSFDVDDTGKTLLVKVVGDSGQLLRQIPSKEILDLHRRLESLVGLLVDKTA